MDRYLVVADVGVEAPELKDFVRRHDGERAMFHLVVPTRPDRTHLTWTEGEAHVVARGRLADGLTWMQEIHPGTDGEIGDIDPILAIDDALRATTYDAIVLAMTERSPRRRASVATQARLAFRLPVVDVLETPRSFAVASGSTEGLPQTA